MTKSMTLSLSCIPLAILLAGCGAIRAIFPLPEATITPTPTTVINTLTPSLTMGALERLDAAFCLDENPTLNDEQLDEDDEHNILRFFPSGLVFELKVSGHGHCEGSWDYIAPYLVETATDVFNHGQYQFSGTQIQFELAPAGSDEVAGVVTGRYEGDKLILLQQGVEMEYVLVYGGKQP